MSETNDREGPVGFGREVSLELLRRAGVVTLPWELVDAKAGPAQRADLFRWDVTWSRCASLSATASIAAATEAQLVTSDELVWHWPDQAPRLVASLAEPRQRNADGTVSFKFSFHHVGGEQDGQQAEELVGKQALFAGQRQDIQRVASGRHASVTVEFEVTEPPRDEALMRLVVDDEAWFPEL